MHEVYLTSTGDNLLVAVPFIAVLALAIFRLDGLFTTPKDSSGAVNKRRPGCGMDEHGHPLLVDPDGRPSNSDGRLSRSRPKHT
jgi:hypothetical protein